jgi:putative tryptophan/tyrosine transport system substrate-binding protein
MERDLPLPKTPQRYNPDPCNGPQPGNVGLTRRRDFITGILLAAATGPALAQAPAKQHRIAIIIPAGPVAGISHIGAGFWRTFFEELRRSGDVEGHNLTVERYSGDGRPEGYADLTRKIVDSNPDVIVAITNPVALAVRAATGTIPIVWTGVEPIRAGLAASLARPGGNITGITVDAGSEIWGKRLQIIKETVPSASKVVYLGMRVEWEARTTELSEAGRQLEISVIGVPLQESTPFEYQRAFAKIAQEQPSAIIVGSLTDLLAHGQSIVESVEKSRVPTMYPYRRYVELGGLMAYASDLTELARRASDDVHQILNGAKPGDIPIYQPTRFELVINLKTANALGLTIPPAILARADEVIE